MNEIKIGFEMRKIQVPLDDILPVRKLNDLQRDVRRYQAILASVRELGQIEPLRVCPRSDAPGKYLLLDGHRRWLALKELGQTMADCIITQGDRPANQEGLHE